MYTSEPAVQKIVILSFCFPGLTHDYLDLSAWFEHKSTQFYTEQCSDTSVLAYRLLSMQHIFRRLWLLGSSPNAILLLCAHAQWVRVPLTIAPRPRLLCRALDRRSLQSSCLCLSRNPIGRDSYSLLNSLIYSGPGGHASLQFCHVNDNVTPVTVTPAVVTSHVGGRRVSISRLAWLDSAHFRWRPSSIYDKAVTVYDCCVHVIHSLTHTHTHMHARTHTNTHTLNNIQDISF